MDGQREDGCGQEERLADNGGAIEAQDDVAGNVPGELFSNLTVLIEHGDEIDELGRVRDMRWRR